MDIKLSPGAVYPINIEGGNRITLRKLEKWGMGNNICGVCLEYQKKTYIIICPSILVNVIRTKSFLEKDLIIIGSKKEEEKEFSRMEEKLLHSKSNFVGL